jgi:hypothetical protein
MNPCPPSDPFHEYTKWGSFIPALMACAAFVEDPILEIGVGHFSTPLLHAFCVSTGRKLISVEQDADWAAKFEPFLSGNGHCFYVGKYDDLLPKIALRELSVLAFIDNSHPAGESRVNHFKALLPVSSFVVVHDYLAENVRDIDPLLKETLHAFVFDAYAPPTLIASMTTPIPMGLWPMGRHIKVI